MTATAHALARFALSLLSAAIVLSWCATIEAQRVARDGDEAADELFAEWGRSASA